MVFFKKNLSDGALLGAGLICVAVILSVVYYNEIGSFFSRQVTPDSAEMTSYDSTSSHKAIENDTWSARESDSTAEGLSAYVAELNQQIDDPAISITSKKLLMIRKALALAATRTFGPRGAEILEAASTLRSVYESEPQNVLEQAYKYATIPAFITLLHSTCYILPLGNELPEPFSHEYSRLLQLGYEPKAAVILAYRKFAYEGLPDLYNYHDDIATVMGRSFLSAVYLYSFENNSITEENRTIVEQLRADVARYDELEPVLLLGLLKGEVEPAFYYAFAYDISQTFAVNQVSLETNKAIDQAYEDALVAVEKIVGDNNSRYTHRIGNIIFYLESLHRRYSPDEINDERVRELVGQMMGDLSASKEMKAVFAGYFREGKRPDGAWMAVRTNFYEVAKKYPELREFITTTTGVPI